jgi:hypothetical protein
MKSSEALNFFETVSSLGDSAAHSGEAEYRKLPEKSQVVMVNFQRLKSFSYCFIKLKQDNR